MSAQFLHECGVMHCQLLVSEDGKKAVPVLVGLCDYITRARDMFEWFGMDGVMPLPTEKQE